jgi:hypothetical protein
MPEEIEQKKIIDSIEKDLLETKALKVFPNEYIIEYVENIIKDLILDNKYKDKIKNVTYSEKKILRTVVAFNISKEDKFKDVKEGNSITKQYDIIAEFKNDLDQLITNNNIIKKFCDSKNINKDDYHIIFKINHVNNNGILALVY